MVSILLGFSEFEKYTIVEIMKVRRVNTFDDGKILEKNIILFINVHN